MFMNEAHLRRMKNEAGLTPYEAHLRCMKNEAGLSPYEACLRHTESNSALRFIRAKRALHGGSAAASLMSEASDFMNRQRSEAESFFCFYPRKIHE